MTIFYDPVAGLTDTTNCSSAVTRNGNGKIATETITNREGFVFTKTYLYDGNGKYAGESLWVRQP